MAWDQIEHVVDEDMWTRDYVREVIAATPLRLPPKTQKLGDTRVSWFETEPHVAFIRTVGGGIDDRALAEIVVREQLRSCGIRQAQYVFFDTGDSDWSFGKTAAWDDIMAKARRLISAGNVTLLRNGANTVVGHVIGDHGQYQTEISREDPNSQTITQWQCDCPWDQFAWQRTRKWKKYEGRPCAHVLATHWLSQSTPLDEEYSPSGPPPGAQPTLFDPGTAQPKPQTPMAQPQAPAPPQGQGQFSIPGVMPPGAPPPGPEILPPFPGSPEMQPAVSIPGGRQPSPYDPIQHPGGTFSNWHFESAEFENSDMVRLEKEEYGIMQGKSEEHGAGQYKLIPKNSIGEVLGQDPTTGWVDVLFAGPQSDAGPMEPYAVRAWIEPQSLTPSSVPKPGPAIRRRR